MNEDWNNAETADLLLIASIMGPRTPSETAGKILALCDTDHTAYVRALELVVKFMPDEKRSRSVNHN